MQMLFDDDRKPVTLQPRDIITFERQTQCVHIYRPANGSVNSTRFRWGDKPVHYDTKRLMFAMTDEQFERVVRLICDITGFRYERVENEHSHKVIGPSYVLVE